jgi:hypothetical protein
MGMLINTFWKEFDDFQSKNKGAYLHRDYIFKNHPDLINNKVHLWHKQETLPYTDIFGSFACRVCSKILGIGSAERSWGDVKHNKSGKRSHLSSERVKKQATIFGKSCIELAKYQRMEKLKDVTTTPLKDWDDDDFKITGADEKTSMADKKPRRIFKAYLEKWEEEAITTRDAVNEAKLLKKYGGLNWLDPDHGNMMLYSDPKKLDWTRVTKKTGGGYCVNARDPDYDEKDPNKDNHVEPWLISEILIGEIAHYYLAHPNEGIVVEQLEELDDDNDDINNNNEINNEDIDSDSNGDDKDDASSTLSECK